MPGAAPSLRGPEPAPAFRRPGAEADLEFLVIEGEAFRTRLFDGGEKARAIGQPLAGAPLEPRPVARQCAGIRAPRLAPAEAIRLTGPMLVAGRAVLAIGWLYRGETAGRARDLPR